MACFFCSALIVGRLAPFGSRNTRFGPFRCPVARGLVRTLRVPAARPAGTSPVPGPSDPGRACAAGRARSCTRRRRPRPWRCCTGRRPCRPGEACRIPRPRWRTRGRCAARHGRNGARDRPCRRARRPMMSPVPAPAAPAPWCPWRRRTPGRRSRGRARRRRTPCSRSVRDLLRLHRLHSASALDHLRIRLTRLIDLRQRTLTTGLRISRRPRIAITSLDHPRVTPPANAITHTPATNGTSQRGRRRTTSFSTLFSLIVQFFLPGIPYHPPRHRHGPVRSRPREAAERSETAHNVRARNTQG